MNRYHAEETFWRGFFFNFLLKLIKYIDKLNEIVYNI